MVPKLMNLIQITELIKLFNNTPDGNNKKISVKSLINRIPKYIDETSYVMSKLIFSSIINNTTQSKII